MSDLESTWFKADPQISIYIDHDQGIKDELEMEQSMDDKRFDDVPYDDYEDSDTANTITGFIRPNYENKGQKRFKITGKTLPKRMSLKLLDNKNETTGVRKVKLAIGRLRDEHHDLKQNLDRIRFRKNRFLIKNNQNT
ncbi:hypothetical protein O0L34_g3510 [Tuta absoluta]|nr:hypothetical protein O0L34_g3510 [Tuta absoluta]